MRTLMLCLLALACLPAVAASAAPAAAAAPKAPPPPKPFRGNVLHKTDGGSEVVVLGFSNDVMLALSAGKPYQVPSALMTAFTWGVPNPISDGQDLMESNEYAALLKRLAPFTTRSFARFDAPAGMHADALIALVADAYVRLGQYSNAVRYLEGTTNTFGLTMLRARVHNKLGEYADTIKMLSPLRGNETLPVYLLGEIHYELGTALLHTSTNYDEAVETLLAVKVFYRPDIETIARAEMAAVQGYRGMNEFARASRILSNILANAEYAVVSNDAAAALVEVNSQIEHDAEIKRRFGE